MGYGKGHLGWRRYRTVFCMTAVASAMVMPAVAIAADDEDAPPGWSDKIADQMKDAVSGATRKLGLDKPPGPPPSEAPSGCPTIALLPGTEAQRVAAPGAVGNQGVRYQYSLLNVGRECAVSGGRVTIKVGADGRVLLGPAGAPGHFDVPIRVAVFSEAQQKPIESRLFRVPVNVGAGQAGAPFDFLSDGISVAIPQGHSGEYSIKVGIDGGKGGGDVAKPKHARRNKAAATTASASAQ